MPAAGGHDRGDSVWRCAAPGKRPAAESRVGDDRPQVGGETETQRPPEAVDRERHQRGIAVKRFKHGAQHQARQRASGVAGNSVEAGNSIEITGNGFEIKEMNVQRDFSERTDVDSWLGRSVVSDVTVIFPGGASIDPKETYAEVGDIVNDRFQGPIDLFLAAIAQTVKVICDLGLIRPHSAGLRTKSFLLFTGLL